MKKRKLIISILCVCLIMVGGLVIWKNLKSFPSMGSTSTMVDLNVIYNDYKSIVADAEVIVIGSVSETTPVITEDGFVYTVASVLPEKVLKGDISGTVNVYINGGIIPAKEFYAAHADFLSMRVGAEQFSKMYDNIKPGDMVDSDFMGIKHVDVGDELLMFLPRRTGDEAYRVTATSYSGLFVYDKPNE